MIKEVTEKLPQEQREKIEGIIRRYVCRQYQIRWGHIILPSRKQTVVDARKCYCYLLRRYSGESFPRIAKNIQRDHSTVIAAIESIKDLLHVKDEAITLVIDRFTRSAKRIKI